ncbi:tetratricopeptide (TPR) repeat protein [Azospirillum lipoferum]|uniref:Tetratricopeptide repeat protein n=1 Tax=Azospirillum lipoferum TaxID=193 RepID=A0A5A9GIZ8_AZOLI|nr:MULTISPECIES: tetratricopeptide repeat protein [Azospirillum]KAA0593845.1 tetratricopeptide repeat protein [Azospirillum lipoferum]MCP1614088.1 tetratricopeptide (TPR) repeat protein [Azospirillum lipoferum]MDW5536777.1 tetratricopeptide repeat protein [Azospirillum sp. NL1]
MSPIPPPTGPAGLQSDLDAARDAEHTGRREAAMALYRRVLELGESGGAEAAAAHDALARLLVGQDMAEAAGHALASWRLTPTDQTRRSNLWQLLTHLGEAGDVARFQGREDCVGLVALGNALRRDGQALRAERAYRRAVERFPEVSFTLSRLACLCAEQHRLEEADALFLQAAERHGGRDAVTRTAPAFLASLHEGPAPAGIRATLAEGAESTDRPLVVYACCDAVYARKFLPTMVRSIVEDSGLDCAIALHLINPDDEAEATVASLAAAHGAGRFIVLRETIDLTPLGDNAKTYYACSRFLVLPDLLARWKRPVLMLDVDLLAIRDLNPLLATSARSDLGMMSHALKRLDIWSLLYADVLHIQPTMGAWRFLDLTRRYIRHFLDHGMPVWFLDQAALAAVHLAGFAGQAAPRLTVYPADIHSSTVMVDGEGRYWTDDSAYFYSVRATGGGQHAVHRLKRRAGTTADVKQGKTQG